MHLVVETEASGQKCHFYRICLDQNLPGKLKLREVGQGSWAVITCNVPALLQEV